MWQPVAAVLIQHAVRPFLKWFWEEGKDDLDYGMLDPIFMLNRREWSKSGRGYGYRRQPDANAGQFRKFDAAMPRFMN
jgi:hypothetical protein